MSDDSSAFNSAPLHPDTIAEWKRQTQNAEGSYLGLRPEEEAPATAFNSGPEQADLAAGAVWKLDDGRLFIPLQAVMDWPDELRAWIREGNNYWQRIDGDLQGYISLAAPSDKDQGHE